MAYVFGQHSLSDEKILVVQRVIPKPHQKDSMLAHFETHDRVKIISYAKNLTLKGKIQQIADTSITIDGKQINVNDISMIKKLRGKTVRIVGTSVLGVGTAMLIVFASLTKINPSGTPQEYVFLQYIYEEIASIIVMVAGACTFMVGAFINASSKQYLIGNNYKFSVEKKSILSKHYSKNLKPLPSQGNPSKGM